MVLLAINFQLVLGQDQDSSETKSEILNELNYGLKKMLLMLKKGEKDSAGVWFKENYFELHKHNLLTDSIITTLARENDKTIKNDLSNKYAAKDSLIDNELHFFIVNELQSIAIELGERPETILPESFIKEVEKYVIMFSQKQKFHAFFQKAINKSRKYVPLFREHFTEKGFPEELLFFIIIESGFDENAISKAGAAGMFQFMPATARQYGLEVSKKSDQRFSAIKSAEASSQYLKDLYLELGSINLALTSYNSGSGKTRSALKELTTLHERGFWAIREKSKKLAKETREYIPQIFAAIVIAKTGNPEKFGFKDPGFPVRGDYSTFIIPRSINIKKLTESLNISSEIFFSLNPDIDSNKLTTPMDVADYPLFVPTVTAERCLEFLRKKFGPKKFDGSEPVNVKQTNVPLKKKRKSNTKKRKVGYNPNFVKKTEVYNIGEEFIYYVKRANTLHLVARIFGVSEKELVKWNSLKFKSLKKGQSLKIKAPKKITKYIYEVQEKTSYRNIALQFNVNANSLKKTNNIKGQFIEKNDIVEIYSFK
ncbi:MAG: transglycosylase SLT domain-containing protein [Calditrichaeota bacterium]|nr:transglycosylase SLT domain-containing protein [Calditrichota bacterium]